MDQQLLDYINQELKKGLTPEAVKNALKEVGWQDVLIEEAFISADRTSLPVPRPGTTIMNFQPETRNEIDTRSGKTSALPRKDREADPGKKTKINKKLLFIIIGVVLVLAALFVVWKIWFNPASLEIEQPIVGQGRSNPVVNKTAEEAKTSESSQESLDAGNLNALMGVPVVAGDAATSSVPAPMVDQGGAVTASSDAAGDTIKKRDEQRMLDMGQMAVAQGSWFKEKSKYYTCGLRGGDCGGKIRAYPIEIPDRVPNTPQDPKGVIKGVCGNDFVYCGLNNTQYPQFFCYYAKLESGGYYTASDKGNAKRSTPPKIFEECGIAN